jgi:hypothetical protein
MLWACPIYSPRASHFKARSSVKAHAIARREWQGLGKGPIVVIRANASNLRLFASGARKVETPTPPLGLR